MNETASTRLLFLVLLVEITRPLISTSFAFSTTSSPTVARTSLDTPRPQQELPPGFLEDDNEVCEIPPDEATVEHISKETALGRGLEISGIVLSKVVLPLTSSVITEGFAKDADEFWARRSSDNERNGEIISHAGRLTHALEDLGPVYVKFGQALAARPDAIPLSLSNSLSKLQDCMQPFAAEEAKRIVTEELLQTKKLTGKDMDDLLQCLSEAPVAAASVGQVYKARIGSQTVAVKVQRPGMRAVMERDAALLRTLASWVESIPAPAFVKKHYDTDRLIATELENVVEEFFDRIFEELDYRKEANNAAKFAGLYSHRGGTTEKAHVIVPEIYPDLCTENVLVMEWLDGSKLTSIDDDDPSTAKENLEVIKQAIDCTLSQLLETGVLHADPHGGNLLKIQTEEGPQLGYLDFGMLSFIPEEVRDALVCAVAHLVFDGDSEALAMLLLELEIVPADVVEDPKEKRALTEALNQTMNEVLLYSETAAPGKIEFPELDFNKLIDQLTILVPRFRFQLPPYFMNKARALGTLEGMARSIDSDFNILQMLYPYAIQKLLANPTQSRVMDKTVQNLMRSSKTGRIEMEKITRLLDDSAHLTGYRRRKVVRDVLKTPGGRRLVRKVVREQLRGTPGRLRRILRSK